jgi:hypothetical protein
MRSYFLAIMLCSMSLCCLAKNKTEPQIDVKVDGTQVYRGPAKESPALRIRITRRIRRLRELRLSKPSLQPTLISKADWQCC